MEEENPEIGFYIDRTYKVVRQDLINAFKQNNIPITPEQWILLSKLADASLYQSELANLSFKDKPTVSRIIDLLVSKNWVERKPDDQDGRRFIISLTEKGRDVLRSAWPLVKASREKAWKNITRDEYDSLVNVLNKVFESYLPEI